jgi:hypothetical protein
MRKAGALKREKESRCLQHDRDTSAALKMGPSEWNRPHLAERDHYFRQAPVCCAASQNTLSNVIFVGIELSLSENQMLVHYNIHLICTKLYLFSHDE